MEKLVYVLVDSSHAVASQVSALAASAIPTARAEGAERLAILVPDRTEEIRSRAAARIGGAIERISAVFECWLPTVDARGPIEARLAERAGALWGYLVTESTMQPCPHSVADGERVPGITQWSINDKPADVEMEDFYREWAIHSRDSFALHPERDSYIRNAVARRLTAGAPPFLGIVLERFPSLDVFTDESRYFGDPEVLARVMDHVPSFYDFASGDHQRTLRVPLGLIRGCVSRARPSRRR